MTQYNKEYHKEYYEAHKEGYKLYRKAWYQEHKEEQKEQHKAKYKSNREEIKKHQKEYYKEHKEEIKKYRKKYAPSYYKSDVNSEGKPKESIRRMSRYYLSKHGKKIPGYQIHHCCTYNEPYKFIYCSKEIHLKIHQYLRDNNIPADSDHYEQIKHLLDETVVLYGV